MGSTRCSTWCAARKARRARCCSAPPSRSSGRGCSRSCTARRVLAICARRSTCGCGTTATISAMRPRSSSSPRDSGPSRASGKVRASASSTAAAGRGASCASATRRVPRCPARARISRASHPRFRASNLACSGLPFRASLDCQMKIRRVEISGFKSFADRVVFSFDDGITGVVGPNGCGKSNVVDAIRWAMGEQSAKHLRGRSMEDVIFSGSESRPPTGMAEVSITFQNDGRLVPPQYAGFADITVSRRLFRDGTSEYEINKAPCRLLDITELFLGTGVGTRAYSIIEQGRIGLIISAKPEDRRSIIEEAAGVTKYKARRKQAERKLEATEQNLLRLSDVVGEVGKRLQSLERSAKKAEKFRELRAELRELELLASCRQYLAFRDTESGQARELAEAGGAGGPARPAPPRAG